MFKQRKNLKNILRVILIIIFFSQSNLLFADNVVTVTDNSFPVAIGNKYFIKNDPLVQYQSSDIALQDFIKNKDAVPVFTLPVKSLWLTFKLKNLSTHIHLYLSIGDPNISNIWLYEKTALGLVLLKYTGSSTNFKTRGNDNAAFDLDLFLPQNGEKEFYVRISSPHAIELPIIINNADSLNENNFIQTIILGLYCGIILSVLLYNLFLFFATKDRSYFIYVFYLLTLGFAQISLAGWSFRFLWPLHPSINAYIVIATSCFAALLGIAFAKSFLNTKTYTPRINNFLSLLSYSYLLGILLSFTSLAWLSYLIFNFVGLITSISLLSTSYIIYKKGYRPAYFYFIAWSIFLSCMIVYLLKNLNVIPTNNLTHFILYFASSAEAILLSIALADRINILKKEKELSQAEALERAEENERLVKEQNTMLELQVDQRTFELKE